MLRFKEEEEEEEVEVRDDESSSNPKSVTELIHILRHQIAENNTHIGTL